MNASAYSGIGAGLMNLSDILMRRNDMKEQEKLRQKREEAAAKADAARDAAAQARERLIPVGQPRVYSGPEGETRSESVNKFGELISDGLATPGQAATFQGGLKAAAEKTRLSQEAEAQKQKNFEMTESGKTQRHRERLNAPKGAVSEAKPAAPKIMTTGNEDTYALDQFSGKVLWARDVNGNPLDPKLFEGASGPTITADDVRTGEAPTAKPQGQSPHAEGTRLRGKDGRIYVVRNGVPVPE